MALPFNHIGRASLAWLSPREQRETAISGDNHIIGDSAWSLEHASAGALFWQFLPTQLMHSAYPFYRVVPK